MNQYLSISLVIIVPIILFICLLKKRKGKFWLDDQGLHLQPLFWLLITFPLIISAILWLLISKDYSLNLTKDGYNQFIDYAKLPLFILTLSPILGAFVINAHRSIQTAKQIEETEKKNKIDIYYSKRKFTLEQLSLFESKYNEKIFQPNIIIDNFFKTKNEYIFEINHNYLKIFNSNLEEIKKLTLDIYNCKYKKESDYKGQFLEQETQQVLLSVHEALIKKDLYFGSVKIKLKRTYSDKNNVLDMFSDEILTFDLYNTILFFDINIKKEKITKNDFTNFIHISEKFNILNEYKYFHENIKYLFSILSMINPEIKHHLSEIEIPNIDKKIENLRNEMEMIIGDKVATENQNNHE